MVTTKDKLEFIYAMAKHSNVPLHECIKLMRYAGTYQRFAETKCNRELTKPEQQKWLRITNKILTICNSHGGIKPILGGDPRGCVVKLRVPDGYTNDWGREGICVPA